eukprot:TRINITY_DN6557_c0_g2_i1.p1 TRINITY_DN6557_c0_g2~~TRINITY_DN6557_c0_g2_i1.p1  ORF type:complete len:650 (+),score=303.42 TRINITY_DN6557_c0_g2_i1:40-1989(+)
MGGYKGGKGGYGRGARGPQHPRDHPHGGRGQQYGQQYASPARSNPGPRAAGAQHQRTPPAHQQPRAQPYQRTQGGRGQPLQNTNPPAQARPVQQSAPQSSRYGAGEGAVKAVDQPFNVMDRGVLVHWVRPNHRRLFHIHTHMTQTIAHWVSIHRESSPLLDSHVPVELKTSLEDAFTHPVRQPVEGGKVNARVLLCPGLQPVAEGKDKMQLQKQHILGRIPVLLKKIPSAHGFHMYGGLTTAESDEDIVEFLVERLKEEAGLVLNCEVWLKLLEIRYSEDSGIVPTVVFLPGTWTETAGLALQACAEEEVIEKTELIEVELNREGMTDEEYNQAKAEAKPEERVVTETVKKIVAVPHQITLEDALQIDMPRGMERNAFECCLSVDAFDEFIKRDMANVVCNALKKKSKACKEAAVEREREQSERAAAKKQRDEEHQQRRLACKAQLDELRAKWAMEDQGKTDDEKEEAVEERKQEELRIMNATKAEEEAALKAGDGEVVTKDVKKKFKVTQVVKQNALDAFEYFDRSAHQKGFRASGFIPRHRLEGLLLNSDPVSLKEVDNIITPIVKGHANVTYKHVCTFEKREEIVPEPEPEPAADEAMEEAPKEGEEAPKEGEEAPKEGEEAMEVEEAEEKNEEAPAEEGEAMADE